MTDKAKGKLTAKQSRFCEEYLIDLNATQAAIRAEYSAKTAQEQSSRLLSNVMVKDRISELKAERSAETKINAAWVLTASVDLYNKCMEAEKLKDSDGNDTGYAKFQPAGAGKALELIGKHVDVQAYAEKQEIAVKVTKTLDDFYT